MFTARRGFTGAMKTLLAALARLAAVLVPVPVPVPVRHAPERR
jgi:hypothetical protein